MKQQASSQVALAKFDGVVLTALRETETNLATYASDYARADSLARRVEVGDRVGG